MSKRELLKLSSQVWNTPHLVTPEALDVVLSYLEYRNGWVADMMLPSPEPSKNERKRSYEIESPEEDGGESEEGEDEDESGSPVVVIEVTGTLTYRPIETLCGEVGMSYQRLWDEVEDAIEEGAQMIVLNFASGGGQATHLFEYAEAIRAMCDDAGVRLVAYVDEMACSAAYALAVMCDEVYANPSAEVGSIGCVVALLDSSKAMDKAGYKRIFITSGENKVAFDNDGTFKQSFLDDIQSSVDKLNGQFTEFVSKYSGIDSKIIRGFEAASFDADEALEKGLITGVMTNSEFVDYLTSQFGETND